MEQLVIPMVLLLLVALGIGAAIRRSLDVLVVDLQAGKIVRAVGTRTQVNFDLYNVTNSNSIIGENATYGAGWRTPTNILLPRLFKISAQLDW